MKRCLFLFSMIIPSLLLTPGAAQDAFKADTHKMGRHQTLTQAGTNFLQEIRVVGEAKQEINPDRASVTVRMTAKDNAYSVAYKMIEESTRQLADLAAASKIQHQLGDTSLVVELEPSNPNQVVANTFNRDMRFEFNDFSSLKQFLGAIASLHYCHLASVEFSLANRARYEEEIQEAALKDARRKATKLALLGGRRIGRLTDYFDYNLMSPSCGKGYSSNCVDVGAIENPPPETISSTISASFELLDPEPKAKKNP